MALRNRGKVGSDDRLFGNKRVQYLIKDAVTDMNYLLTRGFAEKSSLQLVGNRYRLNVRQQKAVQGMSASSLDLLRRKEHELSKDSICNNNIIIDGFNLLILLESWLSGAYIFKGLDGCYRDLSSVHGSYKRVQKTEEAFHIITTALAKLNVAKVTWVLDQPVSNSGRLKTYIREFAEERLLNWNILLEYNPDEYLASSRDIVVSSDAWILNEADRWFNLGALIIEENPKINSFILGS